MKKIILFTLISILIFSTFSFAQIKIDRFCQVAIDPKNGMTTKTVATISFGLVDSLFFFKDSSIIINLRKVNELRSSTDVLNYMSNLGWTLVSVIPFGGFTIHERFYFKKEFETTDLGIQN